MRTTILNMVVRNVSLYKELSFCSILTDSYILKEVTGKYQEIESLRDNDNEQRNISSNPWLVVLVGWGWLILYSCYYDYWYLFHAKPHTFIVFECIET